MTWKWPSGACPSGTGGRPSAAWPGMPRNRSGRYWCRNRRTRETPRDPAAVAVMVGVQGGLGLYRLGYVPRTLALVVAALGSRLSGSGLRAGLETFFRPGETKWFRWVIRQGWRISKKGGPEPRCMDVRGGGRVLSLLNVVYTPYELTANAGLRLA
jgi:hypothetical protein